MWINNALNGLTTTKHTWSKETNKLRIKVKHVHLLISLLRFTVHNFVTPSAVLEAVFGDRGSHKSNEKPSSYSNHMVTNMTLDFPNLSRINRIEEKSEEPYKV